MRFVLPASFVCLAATVLVSPASAQAADYESPPHLDAGELLGESATRGEHFQIEPGVRNDGLMNLFVVESEFQRVDAYGNSLALERAAEQGAIAALREIKKTDPRAVRRDRSSRTARRRTWTLRPSPRTLRATRAPSAAWRPSSRSTPSRRTPSSRATSMT